MEERDAKEELFAKFKGVPSKVRIFSEEGSLEALLPLLPDAIDLSNVVVAFDFDQTLKVLIKGQGIGVRGGEASVRVLQELRARGAHLLVISAASPSVTTGTVLHCYEFS